MAPPVKEPGQSPDVTAPLVSKETDVMCVLRGSKVITVISVWRGSREMIASTAPPDFRVMDV